MSCEYLVCASCAAPVVEGRCLVCRSARSRLHRHDGVGFSPQLMLLVAVLLAVVAVALVHLPG